MDKGQELINHDNIFSFTVRDIDGKDLPMSKLQGKKIMIVNVASKCGFTPQYEQLESLYEKYKSEGFIIVAFPANNFMNQELFRTVKLKNSVP